MILIMKKAIIYVPGLNDNNFINRNIVKLLPYFWKGYEVHIISPIWSEGKEFEQKLKFIINKIDELSKKGHAIYLFGQSAGGSAVLNAFVARKTKVKKVVNICGRLRKAQGVFPSLDFAARGNPAFKESVLIFENSNEKKLTMKDRKKILTIKPFLDEIVPSSTASLKGATNITIPVMEHSLGGVLALTLFSSKIKDFLLQ